jgi:hypothetical protein
VLVIHGLGALVALALPNDVLGRSLFLEQIIDFLASLFPIIDNFSQRSDFPEIMRFQIALMLLCVPYIAYLWMQWPGLAANRGEILRRVRQSSLRLLMLYLLILLLPVSAYVFLFLVQGSDFQMLPFQSSRLSLAIIGPVLFAVVPAGFFVTLVQMCRVLAKH